MNQDAKILVSGFAVAVLLLAVLTFLAPLLSKKTNSLIATADYYSADAVFFSQPDDLTDADVLSQIYEDSEDNDNGR